MTDHAKRYRDRVQQCLALAETTPLQDQYLTLAAQYLKLAEAEEGLTVQEQPTALAAYLGRDWKAKKSSPQK